MGLLVAQLAVNRVLWAALIPWGLAQLIKVPLHYLLHREWDWGLLLSTGGMPSSHSALVTGAFVLAMIVVYDATGVRRHAGDHARVINLMIDELLTGHPLAEKELKEVLGHTPREVLAGILLGLVIAFLVTKVW